MLRTSRVLGVVAVIVMVPAGVSAQYGYPAGYGNYGWGGWGSTIPGSIARGLGAFNVGRGVYNYDTAAARSINTDTVMRWNQYVYLAQQAAANRHASRVRARMARSIRLKAEIDDRLRNHPETDDITDGDALNVLLEVLLNPAVVGSSLRLVKTPIKAELIQEIPFEYASEGMTICLDQMTMHEQWPLALRVEAFRPEREALRSAVAAALEEDKEGNLQPATIEKVQSAIDQLRLKFEKLVPPSGPDSIPAQSILKGMAGLTKMLYSPKAEQIIAELEDYEGTTLGDLLGFMQAFNLRFAPANSFRQRRIYLKLYPLLAEQANGSLGSAAGVADEAAKGAAGNDRQTARAVERTGGEAAGGAESLGSKAIEGMKSAAVDLFKDMDWRHLSGSPKPAPARP